MLCVGKGGGQVVSELKPQLAPSQTAEQWNTDQPS